jgi:hypothetical protein
MKVTRAYLCYSCKEVNDGAPAGVCQACGSAHISPLDWLTRPASERRRWLKRIRAKESDDYGARNVKQ